jgi:hypothetical protein
MRVLHAATWIVSIIGYAVSYHSFSARVCIEYDDLQVESSDLFF